MNDSVVTVKSRHTKTPGKWLLLIHQIPPKPDYFRVKVRRRLQRIGAVALKNSVYVLPLHDQTLEDFRWLLREIVADGGEASVCEAAFIEGITAPELEAMFAAERDAEYAEVVLAAEQAKGSGELEAELGRLRHRIEEIHTIDYFGAPGRRAADRAITSLEGRLSRPAVKSARGLADMREHTWVTRKNVHVDRIASAWLIRRFIDPNARFKFTGTRSYRPKRGEVRFDMFEAEYTHEGDRCTFETLLGQSGLRDRALRAIGEIVHDIDCKDTKFNREEAPGIAAIVRGLVRAYPDDDSRLEQGAAAFDQLYASLR
jgi:hypothetical protein